MSDQSNGFIGAFVYRPGNEPGTIDADWAQSTRKVDVLCKGSATGGPASGFEGTYSIVYRNEHGEPSKTYEVRIDRDGEVYHLSWHRDGRQVYRGIGMQVSGALVGGWGPAD